jgi:molecular chaperone DnaK
VPAKASAESFELDVQRKSKPADAPLGLDVKRKAPRPDEPLGLDVKRKAPRPDEPLSLDGKHKAPPSDEPLGLDVKHKAPPTDEPLGLDVKRKAPQAGRPLSLDVNKKGPTVDEPLGLDVKQTPRLTGQPSLPAAKQKSLLLDEPLGLDVKRPALKSPVTRPAIPAKQTAAIHSPRTLELDVKPPSLDLDVKPPSLDLDVKPPSLDLDVKPPSLELDVKPAFPAFMTDPDFVQRDTLPEGSEPPIHASFQVVSEPPVMPFISQEASSLAQEASSLPQPIEKETAFEIPIFEDEVGAVPGFEHVLRDTAPGQSDSPSSVEVTDAARARGALLLDVTPRALGVAVAGGYCDIVIDRNAAIPVEQSRLFSTSTDNQTEVSINIYQGESRRIEDNTKLGHILLSRLRPAPRGVIKIRVTFEIDTDGILGVSARNEESKEAESTKIILAGGLDEDKVKALVQQYSSK